jgi:MFS transporter, DHA3 family, macrolide efflux protein
MTDSARRTAAAARSGVIGLLRQPLPRLLWAGQLASVAGDRLYAVALVWVTLTLTGSPAAVAGAMLAGGIPFLPASLISGWLADRHDALRLARGVDFARAGAVAVLPAMSAFGWLSLPAVFAVAVVLSGLDAFFLPAVQASLPRLIEPAGLTPMVSLLDSTDRLGRVLGPGLVGLLAFLPEIHLFSLDAVTFLISAVTLTAIHRRIGAAPTDLPLRWHGRITRASLLAGWRATLSRPALRDALLLRAACNVAWPAYTLAIPFLIAGRFHHGIGGYGLGLAAFGVGNVIGTLLAARVPRSWLYRVCCFAWAGAGLGFAAVASASTYPLFLAATAMVGVCTPLANVTVNAAIAATVPGDLLARAYAAQRLAVVAAGTAGLPAAAALISRHGAATTLYLSAGFVTAAATGALVSAQRRGRIS